MCTLSSLLQTIVRHTSRLVVDCWGGKCAYSSSTGLFCLISACVGLHLSLSLSLSLSIYVSVYISIYTSFYLSIYLSIYLSVCLWDAPCRSKRSLQAGSTRALHLKTTWRLSSFLFVWCCGLQGCLGSFFLPVIAVVVPPETICQRVAAPWCLHWPQPPVGLGRDLRFVHDRNWASFWCVARLLI